MTRTRWLAALAVTLLLGSSPVWAQAPCCCLPCPPQPSEAARAPYYGELPHVLFPTQATILAPQSNPALWARLFEAVARNCCQEVVTCAANAECNSCHSSRHEARNRRMAYELLKLYRVFYRAGHYHAAEVVAGRALQLDPPNIAAEAALSTARLATDAIDHCRADCCDAEACESVAAPAPCCAICVGYAVKATCCKAADKACCECCCKAAGKGCCEGCCKAAGKACCKGKASCTKASCACGANCECAKEKSCACGKDCCCKKKSVRQNVLHRRRVCMPMPMMCPFCAEFQGVLPHPVPAMVPHPLAGMMPPVPHPGLMLPHPQPNACWIATPQCPVMQAEQIGPPCILNNPMPNMSLTSTSSTSAARALQVTVCGTQVRLVCPSLEARCDSVKALPDGRALLEGNVEVTFTRENRPARIQAERIIVDLEDGSYEVSPPRRESQSIRSIGHSEAPSYYVKKRLCSGASAAPCPPVTVAPCCPYSGIPSYADQD